MSKQASLGVDVFRHFLTVNRLHLVVSPRLNHAKSMEAGKSILS
jgi:hypothetical protein